MEIRHINHTQKDYHLTHSDYRAVEKSKNKESIENIFTRFINKLVEFFTPSNRDNALKSAHDFHNDSLPAEERLTAFFNLKEMAGHGNGDAFKLESQNGQVHAHIDLDDEIKSKTLSIGYNEFVKIKTSDWFPPTKTLEAEAVLDKFLAHSTSEDIKLSSYEKLMRWVKPEYRDNFIHATSEKSSFHRINLGHEGVANPGLSYVSFDVKTAEMEAILNEHNDLETLFNKDAPRTNFIVNGQKIPTHSMKSEEIKNIFKKTATEDQFKRLIKTCNQNTENSLIMGEGITDFRGHDGEKISMINFPAGCSTSYTSIEMNEGQDVKVKMFKNYDIARTTPGVFTAFTQATFENEIYTSLTHNIEFTIKHGEKGRVEINKIEVKAGHAPRNDFIDEN